jgi:glycerol-3-phosphate dehydrogenase (NAD(P)+)
MMQKATIFVAGSWGTALANVLADNGVDVLLWTRHASQAEEINQRSTNDKYVSGSVIANTIRSTTSIQEAATYGEALIFVAPSAAMREVVRAAHPHIHDNQLIIHATKGFEAHTLERMSQVIEHELPQCQPGRVVVLSGPSHAEEVIRRLPTTIVVASQSQELAQSTQDLLINSYFRVYTNLDPLGVEIAGALKNVIALGAGMSDGLGYGDNAKAALITRGLAEITRLGVAMGSQPATFAGLAGVGDLVVTCTSQHSRNWRTGYQLAQGKTLSQILDELGMVVEGVRTTQAAIALSQRYGVEMPIAAQLHEVLFQGKHPRSAVEDLMGRVKTDEKEHFSRSI